MPKPLMSPGVADPATTTGRDLRAIIQSPMKKEIVMKDHPRSMHLDLLARARAALASHAEGDADIAEIIADLDTAILSIDRAPVAWVQDSLIDPEYNARGDADGGHEGMGATIVACVDAPPVLDLAEHVLDLVPLAIERRIVRNWRFPVRP